MSFDSLFGGGGSSKPASTGADVFAPGYSLTSATDANGKTSTVLGQTGSPQQTAFNTYFPQSLSQLDTLRSGLTPGFSQLRQAALGQVNNSAASAISNLRDNLARRRVAGSSFGEDALSRAEAEFAQKRADVAGQSYLQELQANRDIINQRASLISDALNRELSTLGLSSNFGLQLSQLISNNANFQQQLAAQKSAGLGQLLGTGSGLLLSSFGSGGAFGPGGAFGGPLQVAGLSSASSAAVPGSLAAQDAFMASQGGVDLGAQLPWLLAAAP